MEEGKFNTEVKQSLQDKKFEREVITFVGKNASYYIRAFRKIEEGRTSWNWAAFFFGSYWLAYRKMLRETLIIVVIVILLNFVVGFVVGIMAGISGLDQSIADEVVGLAAIPIWLILNTFLGIYGNDLYYKHVKRKIKEIEDLDWDEELKNAELTRAGGTALSYALLLLLIFVVLNALSIALRGDS